MTTTTYLRYAYPVGLGVALVGIVVSVLTALGR